MTVPPPIVGLAAPTPVASGSAPAPPVRPAPLPDPKVATAQLKKALADATKLQQLPATVQPSLAQSAVDYPNSGGCEVDDVTVTPKLPCDSFGDPLGTKQVVLIGDSHAGMWLSAMNAIAVNNHWKLTFFAKSGCPIGDYPDYVNPSLKRTYTECNTWRTTTIADVVAMHPDLVVVGSQARSIDATEPKGLEESVKELKSGGGKVVFIGDTPSPAVGGSVPDCLSINSENVQRCAIPRSESALTSAARQAEISGAKKAGATVIDPTPWFCTSTECPAVVANTIVYEDNSHITATYGQLLAPELGNALARLI